MQIRALSERVTQIRTEILVLGFFQDVRPVRGLAGEVDWIHNGIFSHLMKQQKLNGQCGEAMLLVSEAKLLTPKVLLVGLGPSPSYNDSVLRQALLDIRSRLAALKVKRFAIETMGVGVHLMGWKHFFDVFLATFKNSVAAEDLDVTLLASGDEEARAMTEQIRSISSASDVSAFPTHKPDPAGQPIAHRSPPDRQASGQVPGGQGQAGATKGRKKT